MRIESRLGDVGNLLRLTAGRGLPDERVSETDARSPQRFHKLVARAIRRAHVKELGLGVIFENRSAVGSGQPNGVRDDRIEYLGDVQAGANSLADIPERLELRDRTGELRGAPFRLAEEPDILDGDRALGGECAHDLDLAS